MSLKEKGKARSEQKAKPKKIRCKICHGWFTPIRGNAKTCSRECAVEYSKQMTLDRYHQLHPKAAYGRRIAGKKKCDSTKKEHTNKKTQAKANKTFVESKVDRRSARSMIRDLLRDNEQSTTLTKESKASVEYVMSLPVEQRWKAGAKDWTPEQRKFAQKMEIKRISSDFSSIFSSFDSKDYGLPFSEDKKKKKDELPYKFDVFTDDSDSSSSADDESGDSTDDDDTPSQDFTETSSDQIEDEELDATDEENQF